VKLAHGLQRRVHLVVRGGNAKVAELAEAYPELTYLDTTTFWKTIKRRRAIATTNGHIRWQRQMTAPCEPLDGLLEANWSSVQCSIRAQIARAFQTKRAA
jgi:hypothetical protein